MKISTKKSATEPTIFLGIDLSINVVLQVTAEIIMFKLSSILVKKLYL